MTGAISSRTKLITFTQSDSAYAQCLYSALRKLGIDVIMGPWSGRWLFSTLARGDVIHIHWPSFLYYDRQSRLNTYTKALRFVLLLEIARRRGARIVWTAHNLYPHDGGKKDWVHRLIRRYMARISERVLAHGPTAASIVADEFHIPRERITVVPHGHWIDYHPHTLSKRDARNELGVAPDKYVLTFVGTCKPYKNLDLLIETFARLPRDSVLIIAGSFQSPEYERHIVDLVHKRAPDRVVMHAGFIPDDAVQKYLIAGDVLVLPYTEILTSGSAMLGLSFGVPVIAPNAGGLRDVIDSSCGWLYDASVPNALLQAIELVRTQQYSAEAIIAKAKSFDWLESARVLVEILNSAF